MGSEDRSSSSGGVDHEFHVLAVDDNLVDRMVIEKLFKISSCKVTAVESGRSALQYLGLDGGDMNTSVKYDDGMKVNLIVTDYSMPGMTGYELLKKIKGSKALREVPVVIMSSENVLARIHRCLEEGAEEFLLKPVKLSDVTRLRDIILSGENINNNGNNTTTFRKRKSEHTDYDDCLSSPTLSSSSLESEIPFDAVYEELNEHRSKRLRLFNSN